MVISRPSREYFATSPSEKRYSFKAAEFSGSAPPAECKRRLPGCFSQPLNTRGRTSFQVIRTAFLEASLSLIFPEFAGGFCAKRTEMFAKNSSAKKCVIL